MSHQNGYWLKENTSKTNPRTPFKSIETPNPNPSEKKHSQIPGGQKFRNFSPKKTWTLPKTIQLDSKTWTCRLEEVKLPFNFGDKLGDNQLLGFQGVNSMEFPGSPKTWYISGIYCQLGDYMLPTTY